MEIMGLDTLDTMVTDRTDMDPIGTDPQSMVPTTDPTTGPMETDPTKTDLTTDLTATDPTGTDHMGTDHIIMAQNSGAIAICPIAAALGSEDPMARSPTPLSMDPVTVLEPPHTEDPVIAQTATGLSALQGRIDRAAQEIGMKILLEQLCWYEESWLKIRRGVILFRAII